MGQGHSQAITVAGEPKDMLPYALTAPRWLANSRLVNSASAQGPTGLRFPCDRTDIDAIGRTPGIGHPARFM